MEKIDLFINSLRGGGAERVCVTLANQLIEKNYKVRLTVLNYDKEVYVKDLNKKIEIVNLNKSNSRKSGLSLFKFLKRNNPNLIIVFNHQLTIMLVLIRFIFRFEFKIISRNINTLSQKRKHEKTFWHKYVVDYLTKKFYKMTDLIIAQSEGMQKDLIENYDIDIENTIIINNPISPNVKKNHNNVIDYNNKKNEVLYVGSLSEQKGLHYLLKAIKKCKETIPNIKLRIVGVGPKERELKKMVEKLNINKNVIFEGYQNIIVPFYLNAKLTVLSSYYEGFPNVLVESISLGTPIVSFDCESGPSEIIVEDVNGYLVPNGDVQNLSDMINKALKKEWDEKGIIETSTKFSAEYIIEKYIETIENIN